MTARENVIKAIQDGIDFFEDRGQGSRFESWIRAQKDALTLLREQEPVAPELQPGGNYVCGACGVYTVGFMHPLTGESVQTWKYCGSCGKKVKWE